MADVSATLAAALPESVEETIEFRGDVTVVVPGARLLDVLAFLRDQATPRFAVLTTLTAVDRLPATPRFELVYLLTAYDPPARIRVKVRLGDDDPVLPTATGLWPGADWMEREAYDLFGIRFAGHPDLTRILMPDDWEGHPLRRDYALVEEPVEFVDRVPKVPSEIIPKVPPKGQ